MTAHLRFNIISLSPSNLYFGLYFYKKRTFGSIYWEAWNNWIIFNEDLKAIVQLSADSKHSSWIRTFYTCSVITDNTRRHLICVIEHVLVAEIIPEGSTTGIQALATQKSMPRWEVIDGLSVGWNFIALRAHQDHVRYLYSRFYELNKSWSIILIYSENWNLICWESYQAMKIFLFPEKSVNGAQLFWMRVLSRVRDLGVKY